MTKRDPVSYTAPEAVYVDGIYHDAGHVFTTAADPNDNWDEVDAGEKAAIEASDKTLNVQPALDDLGTAELRALAATHNIPVKVDGKYVSPADLITAIKAVDEPHL